MKKQTNLSAGGRKLSLNKKTISNLTTEEMSKNVGGSTGCSCTCRACGNHSYFDCGATRNGNTCPGHNTCYAC